jgi:CheY-like chemotaxis protein
MLQLLLSEPLDPLHRHYVESALDAARTLLTVIGEVLDFSKIEAGRIDLIEEDFRPAGLLAAVEGLFGPQARTRGIDLALEMSTGVPEWVRGDEGRVRQILFNLVGNARKFTSAGRVLVRLDRIPEDETPGRTVLDLVVEDTGAGIPERDRQRVLEPFGQSGNAADQRRGTGLGLPIVRRLAEAMGGSMVLESEEGRGTRIVVRVRLKQSVESLKTAGVRLSVPPLPPLRVHGPERAVSTRKKGPAAQRTASGTEETTGARPAACSAAGLRVLVVEDDDLNRLATIKLLERLGCEAVGAAGGREGLDLLDSRPFDAVLMDIQMPGMDGLEATRRIRSSMRPGVAGLFVAAVTAHALRGDREHFLEAGMDDYIAKPVELEALCAVLARARKRTPEKDSA